MELDAIVKNNFAHVAFHNTEVVTERHGEFTLKFSETVADADVSLVLDVYDLDNAVHPEGHLGWWQFAIPDGVTELQGNLTWAQGRATLTLNGLQHGLSWVNEVDIHAERLQLVAVLRSNTSHAIIYMEKIPVFQTEDHHVAYRNSVSNDWHAPQLAKAWFVADATSVVRIICSNIFTQDAVGNFCLDIYRLCQQNNIPVVLYAEYFNPALNKEIRRECRILTDASPNDTILYFHSTYDPLLEKITQLNVKKKIAYYHGITQPHYLRVFNFELSAVCERAYQQLHFLKSFDVLAANSKATANVLAKYVSGIYADSVIPVSPRLIERAPLVTEKRRNQKEKTKFLYVGRIKSHKKIEDLLIFFANYLEIDADAECWIVGGQGDKAYMDYLAWTEEHHLGQQKDKVKWIGQVSDEELKNIYSTATAYICMSEDEGFCVPLLEAMMAGLPVFAYGIPAVKEVLGESGMYFTQKDFPLLVKTFHAILQDDAHVSHMIEKQFQRAKSLLAPMDGQAVLRLLESGCV